MSVYDREGTFMGKFRPKFSCDNIAYEVSYTFLSEAFRLFNLATQKLNENGVDETILNQTADLYCQSAGIFELVGQKIIPRIINMPSERSPEILKETNFALSEICIGLAHYVAFIKAKNRQMSNKNLCKLLMISFDNFKKAQELLKSLKYDYLDIDPNFRDFVEYGGMGFKAMACLFYGDACFEEKKYGLASGLLSESSRVINECKRNTKETNVIKMVCAYADEVEQKYSSYHKNNVSYEDEPTLLEIDLLLPKGVPFMIAKKPNFEV
ncbi:BRO1 domain-containing protein [Rozella allomycis CSF55]|uniref:BRO1 domain-containing protein n=1 Tax=Rozella allomycis (strain CSF55) TaxID=988480 RepID=A0A075AZK8_ROZAC|nr:BRO1 domain-containing protein [Rozella allomycis CSF55]|eukprot:EPZ34097.1 BRO1 domain-containing protein [Rozella allomycis CSF55]